MALKCPRPAPAPSTPAPVERRADQLTLFLGRWDQRQPEHRVGDAEQLEPGLDRDRVGRSGRLIDGRQLGVDLGGAVVVAGDRGLVELAHPRSDEVRGDEDAACAAERERPGEGVVVAGEDVEALDRAELVVVGLLDGDDRRERSRRARRAGPAPG